MSNFYFFKGERDLIKPGNRKENWEELIQSEFLKIFDVQNLSFLLGAGCSSFKDGEEEKGIPTMAPMATEFYKEIKEDKKCIEFKKCIESDIGIDIDNEPYKENLEKFLEVLFSYKYLMECRKDKKAQSIDDLIKKTQEFIYKKCKCDNEDVIKIYENFYKKLMQRNNNLAKINIFTTNYDLFNERALDRLGIIYSNGFSGLIERYFNPAIFNYAFAEQMDLRDNKWSVIDNFIYFYKLHGSVNWYEDNNPKHLFKIKEGQDQTLIDSKVVMIYPTPTKQNASFGSPYSDLFREFQKKLMLNNNVLVTIGYSFNDEHINNLIYQALTIPTFRLVIVGKNEDINIKKLHKLNDPRIWIVGGGKKGEELHYFKNFVENAFPNIGEEEIEKSIQKIKDLKNNGDQQ